MTWKKKAALAFACALLCAGSALAAEPVTLKFATQNPETSWSTVHGLIPWLEKIQADAGGTLKIELYANQTLAKGPQVWMSVKNGIADMAWAPMSMYPGMNPLLEVTGLAGLDTVDARRSTELLYKVYENVEATRRPFAVNKMLALFTTDNVFLITRKPVRTLEDLKGLKIRCTAGAYANWLATLGAAPVVMPMPDVYVSIQKGTIDGLLGDWESLAAFRLYDVARFVTLNIPLGVSYFSVPMNKARFASLPPEAQQAIERNSGLAGSLWLAEHFSYNSRSLRGAVEPHLQEVLELSPEERQRWEAMVGQPLHDKWLADIAAKHIPDGPRVLDIMKGR